LKIGKEGLVIEFQEENDNGVDRREETLVTRHPGFIATEQVVRDVAAERRLEWFQFNHIMWSLLAFLELLLFGRFLLRLIGANPDSGFAMVMYGIAMTVYALAFWIAAYAIRLVFIRPRVRSFTSSTQEQTPGGENVRTTHTTISNGRS
jgi:hypothetical protein